jgi:hypothetical protein
MFREPPSKRRRGNNGSRGSGGWGRYSNQGQQQHRQQHWDEPSISSSGALSYEPPAPAKKAKQKRYTIDHELTQGELWDDSSLIQAWDAAVEEYEVNGDFVAASVGLTLTLILVFEWPREKLEGGACS